LARVFFVILIRLFVQLDLDDVN